MGFGSGPSSPEARWKGVFSVAGGIWAQAWRQVLAATFLLAMRFIDEQPQGPLNFIDRAPRKNTAVVQIMGLVYRQSGDDRTLAGQGFHACL